MVISRWSASLETVGGRIHLGTFGTKAEAVAILAQRERGITKGSTNMVAIAAKEQKIFAIEVNSRITLHLGCTQRVA